MNIRNMGKPVAMVVGLGLACACGQAGIDDLSTEELELATAEQAWSVVSCGRENISPHASFNGQVPLNGHTSPQSYNKCTKSYIVDVADLAPGVSGSGRDANAKFLVQDVGSPPTNQAACEALNGGAIFYERSGNAWVPLTDQIVSEGFWGRNPFGRFECFVPHAAFEDAGGLVAGKTYRVAATSRDGNNVTRPLRIFNLSAVTVR